MITLFENFEPKIKLSEYIKQEDGIFKIPMVWFDNISERTIKNQKRYIQIRYNTLMRFYLYMKFLRYNGNSPIIKVYAEGLKNKDPKKMEIINKIANNRHVFNMINQNFNLGYPNYDYDNLQDLKKFINNYQQILSDRNLTEYIDMVYEGSKAASKSERIVKGVITMLYSRYYEIVYAKINEDLKGMDLWKINRKTGARQSIQVKNITGKVRFTFKDDTIYINNTSLDLHNYYYKTDSLPYDYIAFYLEKEKKICIIKSTAILSIRKYESEKTFRIKLRSWALKSEFSKFAVKEIDIPSKFLGKDVSQIFYTPDVESEIQSKNPISEEEDLDKSVFV